MIVWRLWRRLRPRCVLSKDRKLQPPPQIVKCQSVSLTHLQAWRTGPHAHTRCTRLAREPTRGTLSPAVAPGPDCWTHSTQLTGQLTRWRYVVGFSGTDAGEEGGAQGRGHRTHELTSRFHCLLLAVRPRPLHRRSPPSSMSAASLCLQSCSCTPRWVCQPQLATEAALTEQSDTLCSKPRPGARGGPHPAPPRELAL